MAFRQSGVGHRVGGNDLENQLEEGRQVTHAWDALLEEDEREVEDEASENEEAGVQVLDLWGVDDGADDEVNGDDEDDDRDDDGDLIWPGHIPHGAPHDDEGQHSASIEDPGCEAEEVDEGADV